MNIIILIPIFNDFKSTSKLIEEIDEIISDINMSFSVIIVNDASTGDKTLETKAEGGPVQAGKPYIVGEKGPEVIIPKSDGNVIANDDSQIFAMLLASNPQLQNVSRQRAERILRSRFPEYFEV